MIFNNGVTMENNGKIRILINIDEKESALILIIVWKFQLKKCSRKRFCWNFSTGNVFSVEQSQPGTFFRLEFLNRERFSVWILQPGNVFRFEFFNRETFFGLNSSTGKRFSVWFFNRKAYFSLKFSIRKRFLVWFFTPENVF